MLARKRAEIRRRWNMSPTRYAQLLNALIDRPEAEAYAPACVHRLQRLRAQRQRQRQAQRTGFAGLGAGGRCVVA